MWYDNIYLLIKDKKLENFEDEKLKLSSINDFHIIDCYIKNKSTLRKLCKYFRGKNWENKDYNVVTQICHNFAAEINTILKVVRIHKKGNVRSIEKGMLPNYIINALWDN